MEHNKEMPNSETTIGKTIAQLLNQLPEDRKTTLLNGGSPEDFVSLRVDIWFRELGTALDAGYDELGAREIADKEAFTGLL